MTVSFRIAATIFNCLPHAISWFIQRRNHERNDLDERTRAGLNFTIIVNSAFFLEGSLEAGLSSLLSQRLLDQEQSNLFVSRLAEDLESRIKTATGSATYDALFKIILGTPASSLQEVSPFWEGIAVLFHLRNVLAHGRAVSWSVEFPGDKFPPDFNGPCDEAFKGGYKKVQDYLLKKKVISKRFTDQSWELFFLTDEIADHFWSLTLNFIVGVSNSLTGGDQQAFKSAIMYDDLVQLRAIAQQK